VTVVGQASGLLPGSSRAVVLELMRHGPLSRSELGGRLGMSPASLTRLTAPLLDAGLLRENQVVRRSGSGRPSRPVEIVADAHHFVGVRLTGEEAHGVLTDLRADVLASERTPLPDRAPEVVASVVADLAARLADPVGGCTTIGVSLGGDIRDHQLVAHAPFLGWDDVALAALVEAAAGVPSVVDNDLVALTKAEHWFGVARDRDHFAMITIGVGTGYGLVVHDEVVESADAGVGLLGHVPLDPQGPRCAEGHRGCAAAMLTMPSIEAAISIAQGRPLDYDACLDLAEAGDVVARSVVQDSARALGRLVALVGNIAMTSRVVVAGEGVRLARVARAAVDEGLADGRDPRANPIDLEVQDIDFTKFARGAAVAAIQTWSRQGL
jgi:predicted NBD/HSP70 family sugar kinase